MTQENKSYQNKEWLEAQFNNGKSVRDIATAFNLTPEAIHYWRRKYKIPRPYIKAKRKYNFNEDYFKTIDTPNKAYWLGFIMADGCIGSTGRKSRNDRLIITLKYADIKHLDKLAKELNYTHKHTIRELHDKRGFTSKSCILRINSVTLCKDLMSHGVVPRKTGKERIPQTLNKNLYLDFLRGFFDGDGCITKTHNRSYYRMHLGSCSLHIMQQFQKYLLTKNIDFHIYTRTEYSMMFYMFDSTSKQKCNRFYHLLYDNAETYLDRKYKLAQDMFKICSLAHNKKASA